MNGKLLMRLFLTIAFTLLDSICCDASSQAQTNDLGHKGETYINLFHPPGAVCTFWRDGAPAAVRREQSSDPNTGFEVDWIDITASHADMTLTCTTGDGWQESRTLVYGPSTMTSFLAACAPPTKENGPCSPAIRDSTSTVYGYLPGFIRMRRTDPAAMQGL